LAQEPPIPYWLYILQSESASRYYYGISEDPERRLSCHNSIEKGFTSRYRPWALVFVKQYPSRTEAHRAELTVKRWKSKVMTEQLIAGVISL
jgi:predicted GIY-YIG superfamily endonuclease